MKKGEGCFATTEVHVNSESELDDVASADIEICCDHCETYESFSAVGDIDTVRYQASENARTTLQPICRRIEELGIDLDNIPTGFFPEPTVVRLQKPR